MEINLSDITATIKAELGLTCKIAIKRVPPCEMRYNDGRCEKERKGYTVLINEYIHDGTRVLELVAHELRHVWQWETNFKMGLKDNFASKADYDNAPEELDANTYAASVVARYADNKICYWR